MRRPSSRFVRPTILTLLTLAACAPPPTGPPPPETRVDPVVDVIHGVEITDDYRWLEDQDSPETRAWIAAQNEYAGLVLEPTEEIRAAFLERLTELMDTDDVGSPRRAGDIELFTLRRVGEPVARIVSRPAPADDKDEDEDPDADSESEPPSADGDYEIVVDPLAIRADGTTSVGIRSVSPDGRYLLYQVRDGGQDEIEIRVRDLAESADLPDLLPNALYGGSLLWDTDSSGFLYVHRSREIGPRVRYHRLGTPVAQDPELFGEGHGPERFLSVQRIADDAYLLLSVQHGWRSNDLYLVPVGDDGVTLNGDVRPLVTGQDALFQPRFREGELFLRTNLDAPNGRVVALDLDDPDPTAWREVIPETGEVLRSWTLIDDRIYATYLSEVESRIRLLDAEGAPESEVELPPLSTASIASADGGSARLTIGGLDRPNVEYEVDLATGERQVSEEPDVVFDAATVEVERLWASSRDGTRVPYFVMRQAGAAASFDTPAMLNGYGGFNVAITPRFSAAGAAWVEAGGIWVQAILRGGSEFGETWHRGGWLHNKQNVFDDFIAVGEDLVERGYTSPRRLAIRGGSNGGLLVGAALTQRPDLFRAVLCGVPDLDMVRFYTFRDTNNLPALLEYGNAADPEQFEFLRAHSPYQAVQVGTAYPAVLIHTGDLDTRVPPLQGRKMAARLQAATDSGRPVILRYDPRRGHAGGRTRQRSIEDAATLLAFAWWQLRLP